MSLTNKTYTLPEINPIYKRCELIMKVVNKKYTWEYKYFLLQCLTKNIINDPYQWKYVNAEFAAKNLMNQFTVYMNQVRIKHNLIHGISEIEINPTLLPEIK